MADAMDLIEKLRGMRLEGGEDSQPKPKVLDEVTLTGIVKHIQKLLASDNRKEVHLSYFTSVIYISFRQFSAKKVIVMTGAGISTG